MSKEWIDKGIAAFMADEASKNITQFKEWVTDVKECVYTANSEIMRVADTFGNNKVESLGGFYAEAYHSGSFNINAALDKSPYHTSLPHSNESGSPDVHTNWGEDYSLKYMKDAKMGLHSQAATHNGPGYTDSKFIGQERLVPPEQLNEAHTEAFRKIAKEANNRPDVAERYRETDSHLVDRIKAPDGTESTPLPNEQAHEWARQAKQGNFELFAQPDQINILAHVKEIGESAGIAALISISIQSAPVIIDGVRKIFTDPSYTIGAFGKDIGNWAANDGLKVGVDSFVKAALAGTITATVKSGAIEGLKGLSPACIAGISVVAVESAKNMVKYMKGDISAEMAASECVKTGLRTCASLAGKAVGQALIPIPILGAVVGSFVASYIVDKGINGIENSRSIQLLAIIDDEFYARREILKGVFTLNTQYSEVAHEYSRVISNHFAAIAQKEECLELMAVNPLIHSINEQIVLGLKSNRTMMERIS